MDPRKDWQSRPSPVKLNYINRYAVGRTALDIGTGVGYYANALFEVFEHEVYETQAISELRSVTTKRLNLSVSNVDDHLLKPYYLTYKHHIDKTHQREYAIDELFHQLEGAIISW